MKRLPRTQNPSPIYDLDKVRNIFKSDDCLLLSYDFLNTRTKLEYACRCGHLVKMTLKDFLSRKKRGGQVNCVRCPKYNQFSIEEVSQIFISNNCKLLTNVYINNRTPMEYVCVCGNISKITLSNFNKGKRCSKCRRGPGTGVDRMSPKYKQWRKAVVLRDDNTCQTCGKLGNPLVAHHLNSYTDFPDQRFDVENGVTLCGGDNGCHKIFHGIYTYYHNTKQQFEEFKENYVELK